MGLLANVVLGWLGKGFESGALAMRILLLGQVIAAGAGSPLYLMTMTGHERPAAMLLVLSAIINVSLGLVLIRWFGLSGAAMATSIAFIFWNITMGVFIERRLKLVPGILGLVRTLPGTGDRLAMVGSSAGFGSDHPSNTGFR
jgi:O-antigen/teichoic acid export membrane protein